ncbi:hypothetical protein DFH27DRAFT_553040, partial [Peziza echinospora]
HPSASVTTLFFFALELIHSLFITSKIYYAHSTKHINTHLSQCTSHSFSPRSLSPSSHPSLQHSLRPQTPSLSA